MTEESTCASLIEMLSTAEVQEGVTVFDHSAEEIGIAVMANRNTVLDALTSTSGWIVTNGDGTLFRTWKDGWSAWTKNRDDATRYARRQDAEAVHREDEDAWGVIPFDTSHIEPGRPVTGAQAAFGEVTGFGASFRRDLDAWVLYTMPDCAPIGQIADHPRSRIDWVLGALRRQLEDDRDVTTLREALTRCSNQFRYYADLHKAAGKTEKAETNQSFVALAERALAEHPSELQEEVGFWRREALAGMFMAAARARAMREGGDLDGRPHLITNQLRPLYQGYKAMQAKEWFPLCEACGKSVRPGDTVIYYEDAGEVHYDCTNPKAKVPLEGGIRLVADDYTSERVAEFLALAKAELEWAPADNDREEIEPNAG